MFGCYAFPGILPNLYIELWSPERIPDLLHPSIIEDEYPLPMTFKFGMAMDIMDTQAHKITASIEMNHPSDNAETINMGAEYWFNRMFAIRTGYKLNYDEEGLTAGAGVNVPVGFAKLKLAYAYTDVGHLADSFANSAHRITLGFIF